MPVKYFARFAWFAMICRIFCNDLPYFAYTPICLFAYMNKMLLKLLLLVKSYYHRRLKSNTYYIRHAMHGHSGPYKQVTPYG